MVAHAFSQILSFSSHHQVITTIAIGTIVWFFIGQLLKRRAPTVYEHCKRMVIVILATIGLILLKAFPPQPTSSAGEAQQGNVGTEKAAHVILHSGK